MAAGTGTNTGERRLRIALAAVFYFGVAGTLMELVLLEHYDEIAQYSPFVTLGVLALLQAWALATPTRTPLRALRWMSIATALVGLVGIVLHFRSNLLFELEMDAESGGLALMWMAMRGATPALAPGQLAQLGLIAFLFTLGHPALRRDRTRTRREP